MEYKLHFEEKESSQAIRKLYKPEIANAVGTEVSQLTGGSDPKRLKKIPILKCCTVWLRNFTDEYSEPGRQLMLVREPDNEYDRWATKICSLSGIMFGYLPSWKNQSVARLMDAGKNISVFVDECSHIYEKGYFYRSGENALLPVVVYLEIPEEDEN